MIYSVKLKWLEPKDESDEMKKMSKNFLVFALSVTEAEMRVVNWIPSNYQDAHVKGVSETTIDDIKIEGTAEIFWTIKWMDDEDGTSAKPVPFTIVLNADNVEKAIAQSKTHSTFGDIEEIKKFKGIVDSDLITQD